MVAALFFNKDNGSTPLGRLCNLRQPGRAASISKREENYHESKP
jgi:hypothetical protein